MADATTVRAFGDRLFGLGASRDSIGGLADSLRHSAEGSVYPTRGLGQFLRYLGKAASPTILDLGPVVGDNVTFFGEELGCKLIVEDLFADIERAVREVQHQPVALATVLNGRLDEAPGSADGVLCWDLFDYLDRPAAESVARQIVRVLKPGGTVLALFGDGDPGAQRYTKYAIVDSEHLEHRPYAATRGKRQPWGSRDAFKLFDGLTVGETYLLKIRIREMLFRKPLTASGA